MIYTQGSDRQYHIAVAPGEVGKYVIMPGDPKRCEKIAKHLENAKLVADNREFVTYTGYLDGEMVSVTSTGIGGPSASIALEELVNCGANTFIRVGTCGGYHEDVKVRDLVIAMSACTDSNLNLTRFQGRTYAPTANFELLKKAYDVAVEKGIDPKVGPVYSSDVFYGDDNEDWKKWAAFGCLGVEMEAAGLYTVAAKYGFKALAIMTVSDHFITVEITSSEERQKTFTNMMEVALDTIVGLDK